MAIVVSRADISDQRQVVMRTLQRYLNDRVDENRYDWLYRSNPFGNAQAWLAFDEDGEAVGAAAAFPRPMVISGQQHLGCVLADFCVSQRHRSLGPALQLQKACLAGTRTSGYAFCYDFPSNRMAAVYKRLGISPRTSFSRLTKPLRLDAHIFVQPGLSTLAKVLSSTGNFALRCLEKKPTSSYAFAEHPDRFGDEFTALMADLSEEYALCTFRSATYLNWRYKDHPSRQYTVITARASNNKLMGYVVTQREGSVAIVVDLVGKNLNDVLQGLVLSAAIRFRSEGATRLDFPLLEHSPWISLMQDIGFFVRESSPVMAWNGASSGFSLPEKLLLLAGDSDS